jgi:hypothetical protein
MLCNSFDIGMATLRAVLYFADHGHSITKKVTPANNSTNTTPTPTNEITVENKSNQTVTATTTTTAAPQSKVEEKDRGAGNGSLMRLSSLPLFYRTNPLVHLLLYSFIKVSTDIFDIWDLFLLLE